MTNKQKALEISRKHQIEYLAQISNSNHLQKISSDSECFGSALEMAEWKDQQFKEYLEKKRDEYLYDRDKYRKVKGLEQTAVVSHIRVDTVKQIVNELFGRE